MVLGARERHQKQQRVHFRVVPVRGEQLQRVRRPIDPEVVTVHRDERVGIDQRLGMTSVARRIASTRLSLQP